MERVRAPRRGEPPTGRFHVERSSRPIHPGQVVEYHGSIPEYHGLYVVDEVPPNEAYRGYRLININSDVPLWNVAVDSISPYRERLA